MVLLPPVWPIPLSLATTHRISVDFFSYGYLDVSVPHVPHVNLCIQLTFHGSSPWVFPHSEICGYIAYLQLPAAYRSLSRPSSAPDAKAFTLCSYSLELPSEFSSAVLFELLEFHWTLFGFLFAVKRFDPFYISFRPDEILLSSLEIVVVYPNFLERPILISCLLKCVLFYLFVSTHFTSLFGFQWSFPLLNFC